MKISAEYWNFSNKRGKYMIGTVKISRKLNRGSGKISVILITFLC